ncbi:hypothetical protein BIV57_01050 [Mangrovactinospora gilvigrisea]|uniref:HTH luxR-type domain-containing protein n=1 Tax=Mangrovactinospora gilvigrisea TaxID=1428644 RepID=A0A1J7BLH4_9ACTN|nr:LuxR family transcriptional regulator [Mangrovactinospora gilvigrisea]OIV39453.1 hypothetical protein BIV57_01050 [Mangrovactinospora gilvigrisea]
MTAQPPPPPGPPLVGRGEILARLRHKLRAVSDGGAARCVVLRGVAGIGKSRLIAEVCREAADRGMAVASGRATELDRVSPLATLTQALRAAAPPLLDTDASTRLAARAGTPHLQAEFLAELLGARARSSPLLLALDDAQWTDEASALALRLLTRELAEAPVLWLLAARPTTGAQAMHSVLDALGQGDGGAIELGPLSADAAGELVRHLAGGRPAAALREMAERAGGNPFLLHELLLALREKRRLRVAADVADVAPGELPPDFRSRIAERLRDLPPTARRLLEAGSVLARPFDLRTVAAVSGLDPVGVAGAAQEALLHGFLAEDGPLLAFRHDLLREAIYSGLPGPVRHALHGSAGEVLKERGGPAAEAALHLAHGATTGDIEALVVLRAAAKEVRATAPKVAAELLVRLVDLTDAGDPERPAVTVEAVRALVWAGRIQSAVDLVERALTAPMPPEVEAAARIVLAQALAHQGRQAAALRQARHGGALAGPRSTARAGAKVMEAFALVYGPTSAECRSRARLADEAAAEAVRLGQATGDAFGEVGGLCAGGVVATARGAVQDAVGLAERATRRAAELGGEARWLATPAWLGATLTAADRFAEAEERLEAGRREAERNSAMWSLSIMGEYRARLLLLAGRLDEAERTAEEGLRFCRGMGAVGPTPPLHAALARVAILRDDLASAARQLVRAEELGAGGVMPDYDDVLVAAALLESARDRPEAALRAAAPLYAALPTVLASAYEPGILPELTRIALRAGDAARARTAADAAARYAARNPRLASARAAAAHAEGLLGGDADALRAAVDAARGGPRPLALAGALHDLAEVTREADCPAAIAAAEEAAGLYEAAGADRPAAAVRLTLRHLGVRRRPARTPDADGGWAALTPAELRVARLVAAGMTNRAVAERLFLSRHTVDAHLRRIFAKVGVSSRVELARLAADRRLADVEPGPGRPDASPE